MKKYNEEHEWVEVHDGIALIGISDFAVEQLGDITFIELPELNSDVNMADSVAFVESVKAASDIYTPISGIVCEINETLLDEPEILNESANDTFIFKIKISNMNELDSLMNEEQYKSFCDTL